MIHVSVLKKKQSSGQTLGLKTWSDTNRAVKVSTFMVLAFLVYEFFKIYNLNCDYIKPADKVPDFSSFFSSADQKIIITTCTLL